MVFALPALISLATLGLNRREHMITVTDAPLVGAIAASISAVAVSFAAIFAALALRSNNTIQKHALNVARIAEGEKLLESNLDDILKLHGRSPDQVSAAGLSGPELIYLIHSFTGGDVYYRVGNDNELTLYRKNLLKQTKVRDAWRKLLKGVFVNEDGKFAALVDKHLNSEYPGEK
jgi:hypothetical protein